MNLFSTIWFRILIVVTLFVAVLFLFTGSHFRGELKKILQDSERVRHDVIMDTILPVVQINVAFDLNDENRAYFADLAEKNGDIATIMLIDSQGKVLYKYSRDILDENSIFFVERTLRDPQNKKNIGLLSLGFLNFALRQAELEQSSFEARFLSIVAIMFIVLVFALIYIFAPLQRLVKWVESYDPKSLHSEQLQLSKGDTEVSKIGWAITHMLERISKHTSELDLLNHDLDEKVKERTHELYKSNMKLQTEINSRVRTEKALMYANKKLIELSRTDGLTKIANRHYFQEHLHRVWDICKRKSIPISIVICDLDHFKNINDTYGHLVGDQVIVEVAKMLSDALKRSTDMVARYGGEEFVMVLFDTTSNDALNLVKEVQHKLHSITQFQEPADKVVGVTLSYGVCTHVPQKSDTVDECLSCADEALYIAKNSGRNRFHVKHLYDTDSAFTPTI